MIEEGEDETFIRIVDAAEYAIRWLQSTISGKPYNFSWFEYKSIAASGIPATTKSVAWILDQGIRAVLSLTGRIPRPLLDGDFMMLHLPMRNRSPVHPDKLAMAMDFISTQLAEDRPILVHCLSGRGRTGMVLAAYLVKFKGLTTDEAVGSVRALRPGSLKNGRQVEAVRWFEASIKGVEEGWSRKQ